MRGFKYKIAHKRAGSEKWNASESARRKRLIKVLEEMIEELKHEPALATSPPAAPEPKAPAVPARKKTRSRRGVLPKRKLHAVSA